MSYPLHSAKVVACGILAGLLLSMAGCGKRQTINYDQPGIARGGHWETAWVNPEMILSDTLFTLIRSERVDSFYVDEELSMKATPVELHFYVDASECFVAVSITDEQQNILMPVIAQTFTQGYYKFTLYPDKVDPKYMTSSAMLLKAFYCGKTRIEPIGFR